MTKKKQFNKDDYINFLNLPSIVLMIRKLGEYYLPYFKKDSLILNNDDKFSKLYSISLEKGSNIEIENGELSEKKKLTLGCSDNRKLIINCAKSRKIIYITIKYILPLNKSITYYVRLARNNNENYTIGDYLSGADFTEKDIKYAKYNNCVIDKEYVTTNFFDKDELQMFLFTINDAIKENLREEERRIYLCLMGDGISR